MYKNQKTLGKGYCIYITSCKTAIRNGKYKIGKTKNWNSRRKPFVTAFLGEEPILVYQRFVCENDDKGLRAVDLMIKHLLKDRNIKEKGGIDWYYSFRPSELQKTIDIVCSIVENKSVPKQTLLDKILYTIGFYTLKNTLLGLI